MGKLTCWTLTVALLCSWSQPIYGNDGMPKYRGLVIDSEDKGEIALFILAVIVGEVAKKLDKGYKCPVYCGVKHNHRYYEVEKSNIQAVNGLHHSDGDTVKEQSAGSL